MLTPAQRRILREHWSSYGITLDYGTPIDWAEQFGRNAPMLFDIGFGRGESLVSVAKARPDWNIVGVEVHRPGIAWALRRVMAENLTNIRLIRGDILWLLTDFVTSPIISEMRIFFPEPWPRAPERRLVRTDTLETFANASVPGAVWRFATDDSTYAAHAKNAFNSVMYLEPIDEETRCPDRPITVYESKGQQAGRTITDLQYRYNG